MRYLRLWLSLLFLTVFHLVWALPPGNYLQNCQGCSQFFNTLSCSCRTNQGFYVNSKLWQVNLCASVSSNPYSGQLQCHHGSPLPPGSYQHTCFHCHLNYLGNLQCQCLTANQQRVNTMLPNSAGCPWISNQNGQLVCGETNPNQPPYYHPLPNGNYGSTCNQCQMNGQGVLTCFCQQMNGMWNSTSLYNASLCRYVQNLNGQLTCTSHVGPFMGKNPRR